MTYHRQQCTRAVNQRSSWASTKKWAHCMSSSHSGYPACPTERCCYPKFVQRIRTTTWPALFTAFVQLSFPESMGWNRLTCKLQESKAQSERASLSDPGHICSSTLPKLQWPV